MSYNLLKGVGMKFKNYQKEFDFLLQMVDDAETIINDGKIKINEKGSDDLVTNLDLEVEKYIISNIKNEFPDFDIVSEEFNSSNSLSKNCFTIDPIDGTFNFARGMTNWATEICCIKNGERVASIIYIPLVDEYYFAVKGEGAYLNEEKIKVKPTPLNMSIFSVCGSHNEYVYEICNKMSAYSKHFRALGSISTTLAYIAKGALAGCILLAPTSWDLEPGLLICKEAGAIIKQNDEKHFIAIGFNEEYTNILYQIADETIK